MAIKVRDDLKGLAVALANAKKLEDEAKKARIEAELKLAAAIGGKDNGSTSVNCGGIKVTIKRGYNYKVEDMDAFAERFPALVKTETETELHATAYEKLRDTDEQAFADAAFYVTATPKKASVELKL